MIKNIIKRITSEKTRIKIHFLLHELVHPFYLGNKYHCNCCNKTFRKLLQKGNKPRQNAQCPFCGSLERTRLLEIYLNQELNIYQQKRLNILHIAPEVCLYRKLARLENVNYIDGDINAALANHQIDITKIPYADNYFDLIICSHVLGHVPDEASAIKELYRVLKKNGTAIIMTLLNQNLEKTFEDPSIQEPDKRLKYYGEKDLCRLHGQDFNKRLETSGFIIEMIDYRKKLSPYLQNRNRLGNGEREIIFKCIK